MNQDFKVKAGEFEGPMEVLLGLIEKRKLHISSVSLAAVTDDYLAYLHAHPELPLGELANFILIAATLMLIKSLALLPTLEVTPEESASMEDLERRLKLYAEAKELTEEVRKHWGRNPIFFPVKDRPFVPVFAPAPDMSISSLAQALGELLKSIPKIEKIPEAIVKKIISLEEVINNLTERVKQSLSLKWSQIKSEHKGEKVTMIVHFLGLLELVKQGLLAVQQSEPFADIDFKHQKL
ncbi:MAG: ScpA family protein [bacterium]|nr:ScpA family protein [bacterium]